MRQGPSVRSETEEAKGFYYGESTWWRGRLTAIGQYTWLEQPRDAAVVRSTFEGWSTHDLILEYKGRAPRAVGRVEYSYSSLDGHTAGWGFEDLPRSGRVHGGGGSNSATLPSTRDEYSMTIKWNGQTETLRLAPKAVIRYKLARPTPSR